MISWIFLDSAVLQLLSLFIQKPQKPQKFSALKLLSFKLKSAKLIFFPKLSHYVIGTLIGKQCMLVSGLKMVTIDVACLDGVIG